MPDWAAIAIGVVAGVGMGLGLGYLLVLWYLHRDPPM
jgi:hypothetical protein